MKKNEYQAPKMEVVKIEPAKFICASPGETPNPGGGGF
jgi:hypothetical protein